MHGDIDGREGGGGCAGDSNGFGSTFDTNEVVVTGTYTEPCIVCDQSNDYVDEGFASVGRRLAHALGLHRPQPYKSPCNR